MVGGDLPLYPAIGRSAHLSGDVVLEIIVKDGAVVSVERLSGPELLARAAIANVKTWRFSSDSNAKFRSTFEYRLTSNETDGYSNSRVDSELPARVTITADPANAPCQDCEHDILAKPIESGGQPRP